MKNRKNRGTDGIKIGNPGSKILLKPDPNKIPGSGSETA